MAKNVFAKLPGDVQGKLEAAERLIPGHWTSNELALAMGVGRMAIVMHVARGGLVPLSRKRGKEMIFADEQVAKWLLNRKKPGRPVGSGKAKEVAE